MVFKFYTSANIPMASILIPSKIFCEENYIQLKLQIVIDGKIIRKCTVFIRQRGISKAQAHHQNTAEERRELFGVRLLLQFSHHWRWVLLCISLVPRAALQRFSQKKKLLLTLEGARRGKACILGKNSPVSVGLTSLTMLPNKWKSRVL